MAGNNEGIVHNEEAVDDRFYLAERDTYKALSDMRLNHFKDLGFSEFISFLVSIIRTILYMWKNGYRMMFFRPDTCVTSLFHIDSIYGAHPDDIIH